MIDYTKYLKKAVDFLYNSLHNHPYYFSNPAQLNKTSPNKYLLISGPSGVGKGTLLNRLFNKYPHLLSFSVSYTTRQPRPGEKNGVDYNFVSEEEFVTEIEEGNFLEHVKFADQRYGTNRKSVEEMISKGKVCVLD